jgi:L-fuconolactonase
VDLKALAASPNVVCKIPGLATEADWGSWQPADLEFYFDSIIECFGFDRVLFAGDSPVPTLATTYERWLVTVEDMVATAKDANAERIYRV